MRRILAAMLLLALSGCGKTPPTQPPRVNHWIEALRAPDARLRKQAAFTLGNLNTDAAVVPALIGALKDADPMVRSEAILALVKCGPRASGAIPALTEIQQQDPDDRARSYAGRALEKLQDSKRS